MSRWTSAFTRTRPRRNDGETYSPLIERRAEVLHQLEQQLVHIEPHATELESVLLRADEVHEVVNETHHAMDVTLECLTPCGLALATSREGHAHEM